jgi:hypothetical protein
MDDILHKVLMGDFLYHAHDVGSKSTRSESVNQDVPNFIHDVVKGIKVLITHYGI